MKLHHVLKASAAVGVSVLTVLASAPAPASARHPSSAVKAITRGLEGPYGIDILSARRALVAEGDAGRITAVDLRTGFQRTVISGLPGPAAVAARDGRIYVLLGAGSDEGEPPPAAYPPASLLVARANGKGVRVLADLMAYELKRNPDGQLQFDDDHKPYDALSNPFAMASTKWGLLIADGGANDVLRVNPRTGRISTFFVPPNPRTRECLKPGAQANPGTVGCDPVPTGVVAYGKHVYVSTLGAEQPGAAAIYKLDGRTGRVLRVWRGFTALTGIAVAPDGTLYASEVLHGAPATEKPPPGFDPAKVGRITRIHRGGVTHAQVTMPTGLEFHDGRLYASSWSVAKFLGIEHAGRLVQVKSRAFH